MWLSSLEVRGLTREVQCSWERTGALDPAGPAADGLALLVAVLRPERVADVARALGWGECTVEDRQVTIGDPSAVRRALEPGPRPQVSVEVVIEPDPPLFGRLRDAVLRDPQLAGGLGQGDLTVRIGWLFTPDLAFASLDILGVALGSVAVPMSDPPTWVQRVLEDIGARIGFVDWRVPIERVATELATGMLAPEPARRDAARRALRAAAAPPLSLPLEVLGTPAPGLAVGDGLDPLHWWGPEGEATARLVHAVFVAQPDVLVVRSALRGEVREWLDAQLEGDEATLEQVLVAG